MTLFLCACMLAACGGGGETSPSPPPPAGGGGLGTFSAQFAQASVNAIGVQGTPEHVDVNATIGYVGTLTSLFLAVESDSGVVLDVQGQVTGNTLTFTITLRGDLPVGDHATEMLLHACTDRSCSQQPTGSPVHLPIHYQVKPNLQVQQQLVLARSGSDPAPAATLPVTVPAEAGTVTLQVSTSRPDAIGITFDGSALQVQTQQVPAGSYAATVTLQSATDARYSRSVDVQYTVTAPAGGEQPLSVAGNPGTVFLEQGGRSVQHLTVTRPTWTSAWDAPQIIGDANRLLTLTDLGNGLFDVTIDASGLPLGQYSAAVKFSAGPTGGMAFATFSVFVTASFYVEGDLVHVLTATSTATDLSWSNRVLTFDGVPAAWTAVSASPLLHIVNGSGQTGVDALQLTLDPAALTQPDWGLALFVDVTIDRAGSLPQSVQYSVWNSVPALQIISPATQVGANGRVYIQGAIQQYSTNLLQANRLQVTGATLDQAQIISDPRFVGDLSVLAVDLSGTTTGVPVTIGVDSALLPTQVQMQVQAPLRAAGAFQALPYAGYRPGQFAPGLGALYFAGPDTIYRWAYGAGAWTFSQSSLPGVIDIAPAPDDGSLYAVDPGHVLALDPATLSQRTVGPLRVDPSFATSLDNTAMSGMRGFAFSADGRALASISNLFDASMHGVAWICSPMSGRIVPALTAAPGQCDPGTQINSSGPIGSGLVRSANGTIVIGVNAAGGRSIYRAAQRAWVFAPRLAPGTTIAALSDGGSRMVRNDGALMDGNDTELGNLGSVVPLTHVPGGYGLSSGGRFGLVYGYRITGAGSSARATDATLWVLDLNNAASSGVATAPVVAAIAMPSAVGCTDVPVAGETCQHGASIAVAPGDGTAFVLGPRGVVALPLPVGVTSGEPLSISRKGAEAKTPSPLPSPVVRWPLRGVAKP
ncbi:MAG: hypothetical protein ABJA61_01560 [Caldimonas sp.]